MNEHMSGRGRKNDIHSRDVHKDVHKDVHTSEIQYSDATTEDVQVDLVEQAARSEVQTSGSDDAVIADMEYDAKSDDEQTQLKGNNKTTEDETIEIGDVLPKGYGANEQTGAETESGAESDKTNPIQDIITEDTIEQYLVNHPDLFRRRPDILSRLQIPHVEADGASSLVEKQVNRLRLELSNKHSHFEQVVESARMAEQQQARVHRITLSLVSASSENEVVERVLASLKVDFNIDFVAIRLQNEIEPQNTDAYTMLRDRVAQGRSFCDHRLPKRSMEWLFKGETENIASCAVVPIIRECGEDKVLGIIGLGDADPDRFSRDMGTVYLDRLGQLIGAVIARL